MRYVEINMRPMGVIVTCVDVEPIPDNGNNTGRTTLVGTQGPYRSLSRALDAMEGFVNQYKGEFRTFLNGADVTEVTKSFLANAGHKGAL